jgi:capsular polysaccharide biosynthesis protein
VEHDRNEADPLPIGREQEAQDERAGLDYACIQEFIDEARLADIVIITDNAPVRTGNYYAVLFPDIRVHVLTGRQPPPNSLRRAHSNVAVVLCQALPEVEQYLQSVPPVQLLLDGGSEKGMRRRFPRLLPRIELNGLYVLCGPPAENVLNTLDDVSTVSVVVSGRVTALRIDARHVRKLHEDEADAAIGARLDAGRFSVIRSLPSVSVLPPAIWVNEEDMRISFPAPLVSPPLYLRIQHSVMCAPRQLAVMDEFALPSSFHQHLKRRLHNRSVHTVELDGVTMALRDVETARLLPGTYLHLDSEFPWHFGHFITQDIAKLWGWAEVKRRHPDAKVLISCIPADDGSKTGPKRYQLEILAGLGIDADSIECIDAPVIVERLYTATSSFYQKHFVHPEAVKIWNQLRDALRLYDGAQRPKRIYVSRRGIEQRACVNEEELEALFVSHGFTSIKPESMTIREQVELFAGAEAVAGCSGSGMFSSIYSTTPGTRIVFGTARFRARNEYTIAAAKGDHYYHFFCPADSPDEFHSTFSFDFLRDGAQLDALLSKI